MSLMAGISSRAEFWVESFFWQPERATISAADFASAREFLPGLTPISKDLKSAETRIEILAEKRAKFRLIGCGKKVDAEIRRADRVGFFDYELATSIEARHRTRKAESEKKSEQREHGRINRPGPFVRQLVVSFRARQADPEANFQAEQNAEK
jgi:hypothetical protein